MYPKSSPKRFRAAAFVALSVLVCLTSGCARLLPGGLAGSSRKAKKVIRRTIKAHRAERRWKARDGMEIDAVWKTVMTATVVDENPALIQMTLGPEPRVRINYTKVDHTYGYGDMGAWAMYVDEPARDEPALQRATYTTKMTAFLFSLPAVLTAEGVKVINVQEQQWAGKTFDLLTIGFKDDRLMWAGDTLTLWVDRSSGLLQRCFWNSTGEGSAFGPPPNYIWIEWSDYQPVDGVPLARKWTFFRADATGSRREGLFDLEIEGALANRMYMPILFREPIVEPNIPQLPKVGTGRGPAIVPKGNL